MLVQQVPFPIKKLGSRIHVYEFTKDLTLRYETFEQLKPGLSSYPDNPKEAAASLKPLLNVAYSAIPRKRWACTPLVLKATAGLRMLGQKANDILLQVNDTLQASPFKVQDVGIMDGKDEGVFAWFTINYLLGKMDVGKETVAIMDLGGGSTQIVFESTTAIAKDHMVDFTYSNVTFRLYQHSFG